MRRKFLEGEKHWTLGKSTKDFTFSESGNFAFLLWKKTLYDDWEHSSLAEFKIPIVLNANFIK